MNFETSTLIKLNENEKDTIKDCLAILLTIEEDMSNNGFEEIQFKDDDTISLFDLQNIYSILDLLCRCEKITIF